MKLMLLPLVGLLCLVGCHEVKDTAKATINQSGEAVGKVASEFVEGVATGVEETLACTLELSDQLVEKGITTGKYTMESQENTSSNNKLSLYLIFDQAYQGEITVKAMDKDGLEIGRSKLDVNRAKGEAGYHEFNFDPLTDVESKSVFIIE